MSTLSISEFKKKIIPFLEKLTEKSESITLTKYGKPVAKIIPLGNGEEEDKVDNTLEDSILFEKDLISPIDEKWNAES